MSNISPVPESNAKNKAVPQPESPILPTPQQAPAVTPGLASDSALKNVAAPTKQSKLPYVVLVLGILSLLISPIPFLAVVIQLAGIISAIVGIKTPAKKSYIIIGLVISIIGLAISAYLLYTGSYLGGSATDI